jgi:hypothetical protein
MVAGANNALSSSSTIKLVKEFPEAYEALGSPGSLAKVAREVLGLGAAEVAYINAIPAAVQESMRAAIFASVRQGKPVQISYVPALEFETRIVDYGQALSVQLRGPYEAASPGAAYAKKARRGGGKTGTRRRTAKPARRVKAKPARRRAR